MSEGGDMDLLLICRDGLENSVLTNLIFAIEAKRKGADVGILFTQGALLTIANQAVFDWSPSLRDRPTRVKIAGNAKKLGIQTCDAPTSRYSAVSTKELIKGARATGVSLLACPVWIKFLECQEQLPSEIAQIDFDTALKTIREAKKVIGTF
jgi:peroxiredoxin family protein